MSRILGNTAQIASRNPQYADHEGQESGNQRVQSAGGEYQAIMVQIA
ncbi:hypothetical protein [Alicycliphilus denitrificans]